MVSTILLIVMVVYASYGLKMVLTRANPQISKTTLMLSDDEFQSEFRPQNLGFNIAFGVRQVSDYSFRNLDPTIAYFYARQITYIPNITTNSLVRTAKLLPVATCGEKNFNYSY